MTKLIDNGNQHVEQLMRLGVELLNIPSTAASVLAALYKQRCINETPLSMKAIGKLTGLSVTTISSLCTILESSGILDRQAQFGSTGRGRKKLLFSMRMGLQSFLSFAFRKHLKEIERVYKEMQQARLRLSSPSEEKMFLATAMSETKLFLAEHRKFAAEKRRNIESKRSQGNEGSISNELDQNFLDATEEH